MKTLFFTLLITFASVHAMAADTPSGCKQPTVPAAQASDVIIKLFDKRHKAYKACLDKYIDEKEAISKTSADVPTANAAHDAAAAAIKEYNDFISELNARNNAAGQEEDEDKSANDPVVPKSQPAPAKH